MNYFHQTILGLVGTMSSWLKKLISGGVAIRMSWYTFFEKINSWGGDVYFELDSINKDLNFFFDIQAGFHLTDKKI